MYKRVEISINGFVQGVGFRPFIYKLALENNINGWVNNDSQGVNIDAEGSVENISKFINEIQQKKPLISKITDFKISHNILKGYSNFEIRESKLSDKNSVFILPDISTCQDCIKDIFSIDNRRYLYPFTNCTNCGPRFTIIEKLPYDRLNTSMKHFPMCEECLSEYKDPLNRRFHAQPNACKKCGPQIELKDNSGKVIKTNDIISTCIEMILEGKIIALKGLGGYQIITSPFTFETVKLLRERKGREGKPFALMFPDIETVKKYCFLSFEEESLLNSVSSPVVLLRKKAKNIFPDGITSKNNPYLGVMLPYTPLHHILMRKIKIPLIATSGNLSEEPICFKDEEAFLSLKHIADIFLTHNREIVRMADDSVCRIIEDKPFFIRRARGYAPEPFSINTENEKNVISLGGHLKNTISFNINNNIFTSQYLGDLDSLKTYNMFEKTIDEAQNIYDFKTDTYLCDSHPDYASTIFAFKSGKKIFQFQHHYSHILSVMAENDLKDDVLGVAWDGTGFGNDGTIWGGEFLTINQNSFTRFAHFDNFRIPGGEKSFKKPYIIALGLLFEIYGEELFEHNELYPVNILNNQEKNIIKDMLKKNINSYVTSSVGRLFDGVAGLIGIKAKVSFEGEAAMELEFLTDNFNTEEKYPFTLVNDSEKIIIKWQEIIKSIIFDLENKSEPENISTKFHNTLCEIISEVSKKSGIKNIALSGGCFQNKYLLEKSIKLLKNNGLKVYHNKILPCNDAGISAGQLFGYLKNKI